MKSIKDVFLLCEKTGAWYGTEIRDLRQRNRMGDTVLHTVCSWGNPDAVKLLIGGGADINAKGDQGATPLFNAVIGKNSKVVSLLLEAGADAKIVNEYKRGVLDYARNVSAPPAILQILEKAIKKRR
jgi:ankyrin repeat protein